MYDMTGFDYDITDVANLLRLHKRRGNYYDCPFCGDTKGRLNINPAKNVFRCNRCDKSGGLAVRGDVFGTIEQGGHSCD